MVILWLVLVGVVMLVAIINGGMALSRWLQGDRGSYGWPNAISLMAMVVILIVLAASVETLK